MIKAALHDSLVHRLKAGDGEILEWSLNLTRQTKFSRDGIQTLSPRLAFGFHVLKRGGGQEVILHILEIALQRLCRKREMVAGYAALSTSPEPRRARHANAIPRSER